MEEHEVRCNDCGWSGYETDLAMCQELSGIECDPVEFFKGCPNCLDDAALADVVQP